MRSYCTGETKVEVAKRSRRPPALEGLSGDLATIAGARTLADEVNKLGRFDAVIHNAGIGYRERRVEMEPGVPSVFAVNVLAEQQGGEFAPADATAGATDEAVQITRPGPTFPLRPRSDRQPLP